MNAHGKHSKRPGRRLAALPAKKTATLPTVDARATEMPAARDGVLGLLFASPVRRTATALVAVLGVVIAFLAWHYPDAFTNKPVRTSSAIYYPREPITDGSTHEDLPVICADTSAVSLRARSHLCIQQGGFLMFDPCFEVSSAMVACPDARIEGDGTHLHNDWFPVAAFTKSFFDEAQSQRQVGADTASEDGYPFAIEVALKGDGDPICWQTVAARPTDLGANDAPTYWCSPNIPLVADPNGFLDGSNTKIWAYEATNGGEATALMRDGEVWHVKYASAGETEYIDVSVTRAWF